MGDFEGPSKKFLFFLPQSAQVHSARSGTHDLTKSTYKYSGAANFGVFESVSDGRDIFAESRPWSKVSIFVI